MKTVLRISLILILVLSVAALIMGMSLFRQREVLKGRLQMTENTLREVASMIEAEESDELTDRDLPRMRLDRDQLRSFYQVDDMGNIVRDEAGNPVTTGPGTMHELLANLRGRAAIQYNRLNDTRSALEQTRVDLAANRQELAETQNLLAQRVNELEEVRAELATARGNIEQQRTQIATLTSEQQRLQNEITEQRLQIADMRDENLALRDQIVQMDDVIKGLREEIAAFRPADPDGVSPGQPVGDIAQGHKGQIILVNDAWNFVVIDLGDNDRNVQRNHVLFVQRANQLVGKVQISDIKGDDRRLAVADIMDDWRQMPIREGDNVFF